MATLFVLTFLMSLYCLHRTVDCGIISRIDGDMFEPLCSRKCNNANENITEETFPKYHCSCSRSCSVYGDCCYDSSYKNTTTWGQINFVCLSVVKRGRYLAVASCPPDKPSYFCKEALGHLPPVTSRVTNITYANIFCASCHGDRRNYVTWNVELRCSEHDKEIEESDDDPFRILYRFGDFWRLNEVDRSMGLCMYHVHYDDFQSLNDLELRTCTSMQMISDCSPSWDDPSVLTKCRSYQDPVFFHNTAYKNAHCAECNYFNLNFLDCIPFNVKIMLQMDMLDLKITNFCHHRGSEACIKYLSAGGGGKGGDYGFSDVINTRESSCVPPPGSKCCAGKLYDSRSGICRKPRRG